jgi:hypothetical protein
LIDSKWWVLLDFGDFCSLKLATFVYRPPSYSRLDYKQHLQMNHVLNTDFCCELTVLSSGIIYYFVYLKINCIYTQKRVVAFGSRGCKIGSDSSTNNHYLDQIHEEKMSGCDCCWWWTHIVLMRSDIQMGRAFMSVFGLEEVARDC